MSRIRKVPWQNIDGAFEKKRRLHLCQTSDGLYGCPVSHCEHAAFDSQRGCRKHVAKNHAWFYYFDEPPKLSEERLTNANMKVEQGSPANANTISSLSKNCYFSEAFCQWLISSAGGGRSTNYADQVLSKVLKFISFCKDDITDTNTDEVQTHYSIGSVACIRAFLEFLEIEKRIASMGLIGYIKALVEFIDYTKFSGADSTLLQHLSIVEVYLKRVRKCMAKKTRIEWSSSMDIETLEAKGHWATIKELQKVIPFHLEKYKDVLGRCKLHPKSVSVDQLAFCTRFIAVFLFLRVKGTRPMTYQFLTVEMFDNAREYTDGFVDQRKFKTAVSYLFDSFQLDKASIKIVNDYVQFIRPLLNPKSDYLLINTKGAQFTKLTEAMGKLLYEAIGKYVNPTRYRQIIETESSENLEQHEREWVTEDQKHSSKVARVCYQKKKSRDVALKGANLFEEIKRRGRSPSGEIFTVFTV